MISTPLRGVNKAHDEAIQKTFNMIRSKTSALLSAYNKIFIAYSGGVDSHVLLHLLREIYQDKKGIKLVAIHVNHGVSPKAQKWVEHCRKICKKLAIEYITKKISLKNKSCNDYSPEEILRKLRYEIFAKILPKGACLVTAHQADDQAETLLLQLFRGAGPKGLAAMPENIKFAGGYLARPLLNSSRQEILAYASKYKLQWLEDESNANTKFDRNLIRHEVMPLIKKRWPAIITTLNRASKHCFEASELLNILAEKDLQEVVSLNNVDILDITLLKKLSVMRQKNVLRYWFYKLSLPMPSEVKMREVIRTVINSRYDAMPMVKWLGAEVRRFRDNLYAMPPLEPFDKEKSLPVLNKIKSKVARELKLNPKKIKICFRQGGEKVKIAGRQGTHDLKKLMQEWSIPPWLRDRIPLVYFGKYIVAII